MRSDMLGSTYLPIRGGGDWLFDAFPNVVRQRSDTTIDPRSNGVFVDVEATGYLRILEPARSHPEHGAVFELELWKTVDEQLLHLLHDQNLKLIRGGICCVQGTLSISPRPGQCG